MQVPPTIIPRIFPKPSAISPSRSSIINLSIPPHQFRWLLRSFPVISTPFSILPKAKVSPACVSRSARRRIFPAPHSRFISPPLTTHSIKPLRLPSATGNWWPSMATKKPTKRTCLFRRTPCRANGACALCGCRTLPEIAPIFMLNTARHCLPRFPARCSARARIRPTSLRPIRRRPAPRLSKYRQFRLT